MIRKIKPFGIALIAMLAVIAMTASGAQAEGRLLADLGNDVTLTGSQIGTVVIKMNGNEITCGTTTMHGTAKHFAGEFTLTHTATNCHIIFGFTFNVTTTANNCKFTYTTPTTTGQIHPQVEWHGDLHISGCNAGTGIVISVPAAGCSLTITNQGPLSTVDYENVTGSSPMDINLRTTVTGLSFHSTGGLCGASAANGTITGNTTLKADAIPGGAPEGITIRHIG